MTKSRRTDAIFPSPKMIQHLPVSSNRPTPLRNVFNASEHDGRQTSSLWATFNRHLEEDEVFHSMVTSVDPPVDDDHLYAHLNPNIYSADSD